jgi:phage terminase small subunit
LTERQRRFVDAYADHGNGAKAARQARYSEASARNIASDMLAKDYIQDAIKQRRKELVEQAGVRPDAVLRMIAAIATFDINEVLDDNGRVREMGEMSDVARRIVMGIDTTTLSTKDGSSFTTTSRVKIPDRLRALELLARHLALFDDSVTVKGDAENPFVAIVRRAQGHALQPVAQRHDADADSNLDDSAPVIEGEIIEKSDAPSQTMASADALAAFNAIDDGDTEDDAEGEGAEAPAVAQTSKQVEDTEPFFRSRRRTKSKLNW